MIYSKSKLIKQFVKKNNLNIIDLRINKIKMNTKELLNLLTKEQKNDLKNRFENKLILLKSKGLFVSPTEFNELFNLTLGTILGCHIKLKGNVINSILSKL